MTPPVADLIERLKLMSGTLSDQAVHAQMKNVASGHSDWQPSERIISLPLEAAATLTAQAEEIRALRDGAECLTEELYQAVLVAYRRGAHEWAWLNFPQWRDALAAGQEVAPTQGAER